MKEGERRKQWINVPHEYKTKISSKIIANRILQCLKLIIYYNQVGFILEYLKSIDIITTFGEATAEKSH